MTSASRWPPLSIRTNQTKKKVRLSRAGRQKNYVWHAGVLIELELELIQTQMAQKPMLRAEVGMRVRCANKASAE